MMAKLQLFSSERLPIDRGARQRGEAVQSSKRFGALPVVLVTAPHTEQDKARGESEAIHAGHLDVADEQVRPALLRSCQAAVISPA
jgi:hypothetical protein